MSKIKTQSVHGSKSKVTKPHYHYFINTCKSLFWVIINSRLIQKKYLITETIIQIELPKLKLQTQCQNNETFHITMIFVLLEQAYHFKDILERIPTISICKGVFIILVCSRFLQRVFFFIKMRIKLLFSHKNLFQWLYRLLI